MAQRFEKSIWEHTKILHLIAFLVILSLSQTAMWEYLAGNSFYVYRDISITQPANTLEKGLSAFDLDSTRRMLHLVPFYGTTELLGISALDVQKSTMLITNVMVGYFAYYASFKFLLNHTAGKNKRILYIFVSAMIFSFFYMFNARTVAGSIGESGWGLTFSYSLIPMIFYFFDRSLNGKGFQNILVSSLLIALAVAGTQQYLVWLPMFVLGPWFAVTLIKRKKLHEPLMLAVKNSIAIFVLWLCISSYWIVVTLVSISEGATPTPGYVLTYQMLDTFSSSNELVNVIRLLGVWWPYLELMPIIDPSLWTLLTFTAPGAVLLTLIFVKDIKFRFFSVSMALIAMFIMFFNKGTQEPFPNLYPVLYDIPIVGWMFRVPSHIGVFLPFFMGMVMTIGVYALLTSVNKKIFVKFARVIVPVFLIFSTTVVGWQSFTGDFGGTFKENENYSAIAASKTKLVPTFNAYDRYVVVGSESQAQIMNDFQSRGISTPAMIPKDHDLNLLRSLSPDPSNVIVLDDYNDLFFNFLDPDSIVVSPFEATRNHIPSELWSIAGTDDPLHGEFHSYLDRFGIKNNDSDYGHGLVFTWAKDDLHVPIMIDKSGEYYLYARYLQNEKGGRVEISSDSGDIDATIMTEGTTNKFVWSKIGTFVLASGTHDIVLTNDGNLNAINLIVLVPIESLANIQKEIDSYSKNIITVFEVAPSDFHRDPVNEDLLLEENRSDYTRTQSVSFMSPPGASHMALQFGAKTHDPNIPGLYKLDTFRIASGRNNTLLAANFEDSPEFDRWTSQSKAVTLSAETASPISGSGSLHILIASGVSTAWQVVSSGRYPVEGDVRMQSSISVLESQTAGLHGKIVFYDENNIALENWDLAFTLKESNTAQTFSTTFTSPSNAKFLAFQLWSKQNSEMTSEYWIDNLAVTQEYNDIVSNTNLILENLNQTSQVLASDDPIIVKVNRNANNGYNLIQMRPVSLNGASFLQLDLSLEMQNIDAFYIKAVYYDYPSELQNQASRQQILLDSHSGISSKITLPTASSYTIGLEVLSCQECQWLRISTAYDVKEILLNEEIGNASRWIYSTINAGSGENKLEIESGGNAILGRVIIYQQSNENSFADLFAQKQSQLSIISYHQLSATKYEVIVNSTRPFMLTMDAPYDKSWSASAGGRSYDSIIVHPGINGFYVEETGQVKVTIEYGLQHWFVYGSVSTAVTIAGSFAFLVYSEYRLILPVFVARILDYSKLSILLRETNEKTS